MTTKRTNSKKLALNKVTVRVLTKGQLRQIFGGDGPTADCSVGCNSESETCTV
jgi:natural product precursor